MILLRLLTTERTSSDTGFAPQTADINCVPTNQEILWARTRSTGLYESRYVIAGHVCRFFDVGGTRTERRKWSLEFEHVHSIIFTLDVSCYDQVLFEDRETNRMTEQLAVWDSLVQTKWFTNTNFIVLFTKTDRVTPSKLEASPFNSLFPDYAGKADSLEDILQYLARRLETASNAWTTRRLIFCNAGSIRDSTTNMAEVAVRAFTEAAVDRDAAAAARAGYLSGTQSVRGKKITHVTGEPNSRNSVFLPPRVGDYKYQYPGRDPAAWARGVGGVAAGAVGATADHGACTTLHDDALSRIGEEGEEDLESHLNGSGIHGTSNTSSWIDLDESESLPVWLQSRRQSQNLMWP